MKLEPLEIEMLDLTVRPVLIIDELNRFWINKDNALVDVSFRRHMKSVKRAFQHLAYRHDKKRIDLERVCAHLGAPYLHSLPGVAEIKQAKQFVVDNCDEDSEDVRAFENRFFDLRTTDLARYHGRLYEEDASQIAGFAGSLSISSSIAYQMAFIYPLLHAGLPPQIHNKLAKVFIRFRKAVQVWGERALKIQQECKMNHKTYRIPLEEIFG